MLPNPPTTKRGARSRRAIHPASWMYIHPNIISPMYEHGFTPLLQATSYYTRNVLTETGSRTTGLSFNVRLLHQLSYLNLHVLFCYLNLEVALTTRALYEVFSCMGGRQGSHMYVGIAPIWVPAEIFVLWPNTPPPPDTYREKSIRNYDSHIW